MTFGDLLDQLAYDADDAGGTYRTNARRWLNLTRSYLASMDTWRTAIVADATFTTAAATTDGLYSLTGYEHLVNDWLYDETNETTIRHESFATLQAIDQAKDTDGEPAWWGDAGVDSNSVRQIYLWPVPDGAYTIRFAGYKDLEDIVEADDDTDTDPFFGRIEPWAATFASGMRYFHDMNNNEDPNQVAFQKGVFDRMIRDRKTKNRFALVGSVQLANVRTQRTVVGGRFDPSHFNNR